jgi:hypothetical protein
MHWALLLFLLPAVAVVVAMRRAVRIARVLRQPAAVGSLLSPRVRAALSEAGLNPDALDAERLRSNEKLAQLVAGDLRRALGSAIFGVRRHSPEFSDTVTAPTAVPIAAPGLLASRDPSRPLGLPPPIDLVSRGRPRTITVLAIAIVLAVAYVVFGIPA